MHEMRLNAIYGKVERETSQASSFHSKAIKGVNPMGPRLLLGDCKHYLLAYSATHPSTSPKGKYHSSPLTISVTHA